MTAQRKPKRRYDYVHAAWTQGHVWPGSRARLTRVLRKLAREAVREANSGYMRDPPIDEFAQLADVIARKLVP